MWKKIEIFPAFGVKFSRISGGFLKPAFEFWNFIPQKSKIRSLCCQIIEISESDSVYLGIFMRVRIGIF